LTKKIILIAGPTASGKSKLAILLAKKINGEILNADSMQVYKEFSILSSRPQKKHLKEVNHHLYGFTSAQKHFSTGIWLKKVKKKVEECLKKRKVPIIVGGTGLYFNAITKGISQIPKIDIKTRKKIRSLYKKIGAKKFYEKLITLDPKAKNKILLTDTQRVLRVYEVKYKTKKSLYEWASNTKSQFLRYDIKKIFLNVPRNTLLVKIEKRTEKMFNNGCIKEIEKFRKKKIDKSLPANKLIGFKEISDHLDGLTLLDQAKELINIKTRQYAKRQYTWSRGHMGNWKKLYSEDSSSLLKKVLKVIS
tara:strand:- start:20 stop:937 length:918 start_codon:yes stop_codon:yes gene_type:complete